ncbi:PepSY domain-containing protein [Clostridium sp. SM-530-WT-3G]|uniref:PepSY domain-containing protein n=1 Tax=Clostridium sp. SM-530-WT-3G TaxID=2725303 RepID=UPI00145D997D|nr:PepSY domain-containing protein [Clostridium sp. SM-530-WT-3G]NME84321.1 hypothetical protein [Clostridium sp. SM-530-WT-3G]
MKRIALTTIIISMGIALIGCGNQVTQNNGTANNKSNTEQIQTQASGESKNEISVNEAKEIALTNANLTSDKVTFTKAKLDVDDGVRKYEIEFSYNNKKYDYEINASTGSVISYEMEN